LRQNANTALTTEPKKKHYQQHSFLIRGGYTAEPASYPLALYIEELCFFKMLPVTAP